MPRPEPTLPERARGALLGHAAGTALGVPTEFLGTPEAIAKEFPGGLRDIRRRDNPASPWDDDVAMAVHLAEELLEAEPDLERLSKRWVAWMEEDGRGVGGWTRTALLHFRVHGTPPAFATGLYQYLHGDDIDPRREAMASVACAASNRRKSVTAWGGVGGGPSRAPRPASSGGAATSWGM